MVDLPSGDEVVFQVYCDVFSVASGTPSNTVTISAPAGVSDTASTNNSATDDTDVNQAPVASCQNVTVQADSSCQGDVTTADVDAGSFDPDGDTISLSLAPPGTVIARIRA